MYSSELPIGSVAAGASAAVFLFVSALLGAGDLSAQGLSVPSQGLPGQGLPGVTIHVDTSPVPTLRQAPSMPAVPPYLAPAEPGDALAALEAVEIALTQASDGATYVWRRSNGRLAGAVRPTGTFRDADGRMCRHLEMQMRLGTYQRKTEGIACRGTDGVWSLEG